MIGNRRRVVRGGNPVKRQFYKQKFNPYHRNLDNLAVYLAKQVKAMSQVTSQEESEKQAQIQKEKENNGGSEEEEEKENIL